MHSIVKAISAGCILAVSFAAGVAFADPQEVVNGPGKQPLRGNKFGNCVVTKWTAATDVCATAPEPQKVETPPPPPPPEPVAKLEREDLTIYFNFNKDVLTAGGKAKLDTISDAVNHSPRVTKVNIVGYTDEIGSNSYNNALSIRRAKAVKAYIDRTMRIPSNVASLRGRGKEDPVVDCAKVKKRKQKIDCMAKDRRVEIEFDFVQ